MSGATFVTVMMLAAVLTSPDSSVTRRRKAVAKPTGNPDSALHGSVGLTPLYSHEPSSRRSHS